MKRYVGFEEISDGRIYSANDMVKAGCGDCQGCHACCQQMGDSLIVDPYDIYVLSKGTRQSFSQMIESEYLELSQHEGVILPNIKMSPDCRFLDENGRCSVHQYRPGICRLFPLGRIYDEDGFGYFLQVNECQKENRTKVKVKQWIGVPNLPAYEKFVVRWHDIVKNITDWATQAAAEGMDSQTVTMLNNINTNLLKSFYLSDYDTEFDFYEQFELRCKNWGL